MQAGQGWYRTEVRSARINRVARRQLRTLGWDIGVVTSTLLCGLYLCDALH